jgi:inosose dehydratase
MSPVRVANAPLSYGAFEMTVGTDFAVPEPTDVLEAIAAAGFAGTDLGPPGYLGEGDVLRERLEANGLEVVGGFVPMRFSEAEGFEEDAPELHHTLDLFDAAGATGARPVLCDAGGPERAANPGRGGEEPELRLGDARWRTLADNVARAADAARERGYEPVFHHHTSTYVEGLPEIERFLEDTDVPLLLDSGHLLVAGGDPVAALHDWGERIGAVHIKDVRLGVLEGVKAERADTLTAWRRGLFCALGQGDVDLDGFCAAVTERGYDGWVVVEQDRVLDDAGDFAVAGDEQIANREWLKEHAGW